MIDAERERMAKLAKDYLKGSNWEGFGAAERVLVNLLTIHATEAIKSLFCDEHKDIGQAAAAGYISDECPTCEVRGGANEARLDEAESWYRAMTHFQSPAELEIWAHQRLSEIRTSGAGGGTEI